MDYKLPLGSSIQITNNSETFLVSFYVNFEKTAFAYE